MENSNTKSDQEVEQMLASIIKLHEKAQKAKSFASEYTLKAIQAEASSADFAIKTGMILSKLEKSDIKHPININDKDRSRYLYFAENLSCDESEKLYVLGQHLLDGLIWSAYAEETTVTEVIMSFGITIPQDTEDWEKIHAFKMAVKTLNKTILDKHVD